MNNKIQQIIEELDLLPHPEGGYYKETYRSAGIINNKNLGSEYVGNRNYSTCIYFLLTSDRFSAFHKINQDEIWHFYDGSPIKLHIISESGQYTSHVIGKDIHKGESPQLVVPGNHWFAASVIEPNTFSLVGCTVSPAFDFKDFILPSRLELINIFPQHEAIISQLTKSLE